MKRLELSTILCLTFVSIVLGWPERMVAQRSGQAGSFHGGGFYGRGSHPAFQGVHAYGNYRSAGYDGGHRNYYGWRAAYGGYYPHYRYGYGWGFRIRIWFLGLTGIMASRTDMVLGGALCTPTPTPIIILIMFLPAAHTRSSGVATRLPRTLRRTPTATPHRNISPLQRRKIPPATTI